MSGILDNKSRIMDTILTLEGRRQIADGKLRVEYYSFTDGTVFYNRDLISGSKDPNDYLYFEQCHLPQDQITFEADDSGRIKPFKNKSSIDILNGSITKTELSGSGNRITETIVGDQFVSTAQGLLQSSIENFKNLYVIGTKDILFLEEEKMKLSKESISFDAKRNVPVDIMIWDLHVSAFKDLYTDFRVGIKKNFKYLPPINKTEDKSLDKSSPEETFPYRIGNFTDTKIYQADSNLDELLSYLKTQFNKETIEFESTSLSNRLLTQIFEVTSTNLKKLDVIEIATFNDEGKDKQLFCVGKVFEDTNEGSNKFVNVFYLIFE